MFQVTTPCDVKLPASGIPLSTSPVWVDGGQLCTGQQYCLVVLVSRKRKESAEWSVQIGALNGHMWSILYYIPLCESEGVCGFSQSP